jgi:hypothetical protein
MSREHARDAGKGLSVASPDQALRMARPLPDVADMALGQVPDEPWEAFLDALRRR